MNLILKYKSDFLAIVVLILWIFNIFSPLTYGNYIELGYFDWFNQAYRAQSLYHFGFASWTHMSDGGQDIWQAFQFLPHLTAGAISKITNFELSKSMLLLTYFLTYFCYLTLYIFKRSLKLNPLIAFTTTLLSTGIIQINVMIGDFGTFIGFTFLPLLLALIFYEHKNKYANKLMPLALGISVYIHPILCFFCAGFWVLNNLNINKPQLINFLTKFLIFVLLSSFYWYPAFFYDAQEFLDYKQTETNFLRLIAFPVFFGLMKIVWIFMALSLGIVILVWSKTSYKKQVLATASYLSLLSLWYMSTLNMELPRIVNKFQITRWTPFMAVLALLSISICINYLLKKQQFKLFIQAFLIFFCLIFFYLNFIKENVASIKNYAPKAVSWVYTPATEFIEKNNLYKNNNLKIYSYDATKTLYFNFAKVKIENDYFHFSQNPFANYRDLLINQGANISDGHNKLIRYFKVRGVKYILLADSLDITKTFKTPFANLYKFNYLGKYGDFLTNAYGYELEHEQIDAINLSNDTVIPTYTNIYNLKAQKYDVKKVDEFLVEFEKFLDEKNYQITPIEYVYPNIIKIPVIPANSKILIFNNYDNLWKIENKYQEHLKLQMQGANYILVTNLTNKDIVYSEIYREYPKSYKVSILLVIGGIITFIIYALTFKFKEW